MSDYIEEVLRGLTSPHEEYLDRLMRKGRCPVASRSKPVLSGMSHKQYRISGELNPLRRDHEARYQQMFPGCGSPAAVKPRMSARRRAWRAR